MHCTYLPKQHDLAASVTGSVRHHLRLSCGARAVARCRKFAARARCSAMAVANEGKPLCMGRFITAAVGSQDGHNNDGAVRYPYEVLKYAEMRNWRWRKQGKELYVIYC